MAESWLLQAALGSYAVAWLTPRRRGVLAAAAAVLALGLHTSALLWRWQAHGHGPFTTMHEVLSSSLWSLALVLALAAWGVGEVRQAWRVVAPVLALLAVWAWWAPAGRGHFLPTYATPLLYLHAILGKAFLGLLLVAVALGGVPLVRHLRRDAGWLAQAGSDLRLDELAHRFAAFALVADSLMLVVGAAWAQDAWGRYWAWDPLETWAFATWLGLVATLHARATLRPAPWVHGAWLAAVFAVAFLTFFGVPFLSESPHKGAL